MAGRPIPPAALRAVGPAVVLLVGLAPP